MPSVFFSPHSEAEVLEPGQHELLQRCFDDGEMAEESQAAVLGARIVLRLAMAQLAAKREQPVVGSYLRTFHEPESPALAVAGEGTVFEEVDSGMGPLDDHVKSQRLEVAAWGFAG